MGRQRWHAAGIALPYWAVQIVNKSLPAITTALALLVVPVVGVACSSIALGEPLNAELVAAMLLIICGIAVGMSDAVARIETPWRKTRHETSFSAMGPASTDGLDRPNAD